MRSVLSNASRTAAHRAALTAITLVCLLATLFVSAPLSAAEDSRVTVAILEFRDPFFNGWGSTIVTSALSAELAKRPLFAVVERGRMQTVLKEVRFQNTGLVNPDQASKIGKLLAAKYLIMGELQTAEVKPGGISKTAAFLTALNAMNPNNPQKYYHAAVSVSYRVVDVETGKVVLHKVIPGAVEALTDALGNPTRTPQDLYAAALQQTVVSVPRAMTPGAQGLVADVDPSAGTFTITLGKNDGIAPGTYVRVFRKGKELKNPATGEVIDVETEEVCRGRCTRARDRVSVFEAGEQGKVSFFRTEKKAAAAVKVGDTVEIVEPE